MLRRLLFWLFDDDGGSPPVVPYDPTCRPRGSNSTIILGQDRLTSTVLQLVGTNTVLLDSVVEA